MRLRLHDNCIMPSIGREHGPVGIYTVQCSILKRVTLHPLNFTVYITENYQDIVCFLMFFFFKLCNLVLYSDKVLMHLYVNVKYYNIYTIPFILNLKLLTFFFFFKINCIIIDLPWSWVLDPVF